MHLCPDEFATLAAALDWLRGVLPAAVAWVRAL